MSSHRSSPVLYDQAVVAAQPAAASTTASASTPGQGTRDMNFKTTSNNSQQAVSVNFTMFFRCYIPPWPFLTKNTVNYRPSLRFVNKNVGNQKTKPTIVISTFETNKKIVGLVFSISKFLITNLLKGNWVLEKIFTFVSLTL